jgi:hypothetical protein
VDDLKPGPRDHLITQALREQLDRISDQFTEEGPLDPAEAPDRLARHAMREIGRELNGDEPAENQVRRVNGLLRQLVTEQESLSAAEVAIPPKVLYGIKTRSPLGDPMPLPPSPATPFSQSDLLVNAGAALLKGPRGRSELAVNPL